MKKNIANFNYLVFLFLVIISTKMGYAQHFQKIDGVFLPEEKTIGIQQQIIFVNTSEKPLDYIILNDWNNAFSSTTTPLANRFSDEFIRSYFIAKEKDRGYTKILFIQNDNKQEFQWKRLDNHPDLIQVDLKKPLINGEQIILNLNYEIKIPSANFTKFGFYNDNKFALKNWFIAPARFDNEGFITYSNLNLDDIPNVISDYEVTIEVPQDFFITTELTEKKVEKLTGKKYYFYGKNFLDIPLYIDKNIDFSSLRKNGIEILSDIKTNQIDEVYKAMMINQMIDFFDENLGTYPNKKIIVSQAEYDKNPFYGLNQLPSFLSPFSNEFIFELKFLKTYLNAYLKTTMQLDARKDNYIFDGMQIYLMMKYIDTFHQDKKMLGSLNRFKLLKNFHITNVDFNDQFSYFYMLMLRKNLDQPVGDSKETLIKYNEQIAGKYRSGLNFRYLKAYLNNDVVDDTFKQYFVFSNQFQTTRNDFEKLLKTNAKKNIDWFFDTMIATHQAFDYKLKDIQKNSDSISFKIKNKHQKTIPLPVYTLKNDTILYSKWIEISEQDSIIKLPNLNAEKIVLNYKNELPEANLRNNWKTLENKKLFNKPFQFSLLKDLENPGKNQIMYIPTAIYNLYDGISPGLRFHNKTMLDKPFNFDLNPTYSIKTQSLIGNFSLAVNQYNRESNLYNIKYFVYGTYMHYAPDAAYLKINPTVLMRFREADRRNNKAEALMIRQVMVFLEPSQYNLSFNNNNENYSIFNTKYINTKTEISHHYNFTSDLQLAKNFGKTSIELEYRKMFGNRQLNWRMFGGFFLYNKTTSDYFSFALDRPTDYLFEYNYYGRSESKGLFSQQMVLKEGAFKSRLDQRFANSWMLTTNASFNVWNWVEIYGDGGFIKNRSSHPKFVYDSGVRFNLVPDYFELYFPVYSSNGWEIGQPDYQQKIRFVVTFNPSVLINLFTRKWF